MSMSRPTLPTAESTGALGEAAGADAARGAIWPRGDAPPADGIGRGDPARSAGPSPGTVDSLASTLNLSRRAYWGLVALSIAAFLAVWLSHFPLLYGWHLDDWACYVKGLDTVADPKAAFTVRCNALHAYFFLFSYLPLWSGISLPSHELPNYGELTGNFRFFILWTILFHGLVALSWAWFAERVCGNHLAAWLSLVLLVTSQQFTLWTPQPETRYAGLPLALAGLFLLLRWAERPWESRDVRREAALFGAGALFFLSQSMHYTSLYLIVPLSLSLCAQQFMRGGWRQGTYWTAWIAFAAGCLAPQVALEFFSRFVLHIPFSQGPLKALIGLNRENVSVFAYSEQIAIWADYLIRLVGWPLLAAAAVGAWLYLRRGGRSEASEPLSRRVRLGLVNGVVFAMVLIMLIPTTPFFRKTSNLQPFWFLFASVAIVEVATRSARRRWAQAAVAAAGLIAVGALPLVRSIDMFNGHLGLGRAIAWAESHRGERPLRWLITHAAYAYAPDEALDDDPESLVVCYFPLESLATCPAWRYYLNACEPVHREKTIWSVFSDHIRHPYWTNVDLSRESDICEARVYRAGDLARSIRPGRPLRVEGVSASSAADPALEAANVFDGGRAPDCGTGWVPAAGPLPQTLDVIFDQAYPLDRLVVLQSMSPHRIAAIDLLAAGDDGKEAVLARRRDLAPSQILTLSWTSRPIRRMRLVVREQRPALVNGQGRNYQPPATFRIEELIFPGYSVEPLPPARELPPLRLETVHRDDAGLLIAKGENISKATRMVLAGRPLATDRRHIPTRVPFTLDTFGVWPSDELRAMAPRSLPLGPGRHQVYLTDGLRRSNSVWIEWGDSRAGASQDAPEPALASEWALPGEEAAAGAEEDRREDDRPRRTGLAEGQTPDVAPAPRSASYGQHPSVL